MELYMGNRAYLTLLLGLITTFITGDRAHLVLNFPFFRGFEMLNNWLLDSDVSV